MILYSTMTLLRHLLTFYRSSSHSLYILHLKVINLFAKSDFPSKAVESESILQLILDSYHSENLQEKLDVITYLSVMSACAYAKGGLDDQRTTF